MISAANDTRTTSGGSPDDWLIREVGNFLSEAQVRQESDTRAIPALISRVKKWSWCLEGWSSLIWIAVSRPSSTERGTTINSIGRDSGWWRWMTSRPSLEMEVTFWCWSVSWKGGCPVSSELKRVLDRGTHFEHWTMQVCWWRGSAWCCQELLMWRCHVQLKTLIRALKSKFGSCVWCSQEHCDWQSPRVNWRCQRDAGS